jgi:nucleotide-binding universal stress UspA family protein
VTYKTIVVHLDLSARRSERLALACRIADAYEAHLIGQYALDPIPLPPMEEPEPTAAYLQVQTKRREQARQQAEREFGEITKRRRRGSSEWRHSEVDAIGKVTQTARCADLVIIGQQDPDTDDGLRRGFPEEVVLAAGKPVLVIPYVGHFAEVGRRALVAWNAGREAARAVTDALPVLEHADAVQVLTSYKRRDELDRDEVRRRDFAQELERHGIKPLMSSHVGKDVDVGSLILSRAIDEAADHIVMGAYGHSRLRERVLGGATAEMFKTMTVPVLMSH